MKSTFKVLFYVKKQSVKNGKAPVMGRITINGTQAGFSCKKGANHQALPVHLRPRQFCHGQESL